jgi:translation initiation factor IF-2
MTDRWGYQPEPDDDGLATRAVTMKRPVTAAALAEALQLKLFQVIKDLIEYRVFAKDGNALVKDDLAILVAENHNVHLVVED